jgi:hypothetical protein
MRNAFKESQESKEPKPKKKNRVSKTFNALLNGEFLTREGVVAHLPFLLFLSALFVLYIAMGYSFEQTERQKVKVGRQLEEEITEFKSLKSELEARKRQSSVLQRIEEMDLIDSDTPPEFIEVNKGYLEE